MRHAAIEFASQVDQKWNAGERFGAIFTTDMLNVAEFKGLLQTGAREIPVVVYFHENQLEYPNRVQAERDFHYGFTNFTSALAAHAVWFNSRFNLDSFVGHLRSMLKRWPDFQPESAVEQVACKGSIQAPGIEVPKSKPRDTAVDRPLHIVWAARWEHDKNPDDLLAIVKSLCDRGVSFVASVVGQQYRKIPDSFDEIKEVLGERIANWGLVADRQQYFELLGNADVFLSTANHEFFGIAAAEAIAMDCMPLLPNRLAYPELLDVENFPERRNCLFDSVVEAVGILEKLGANRYDFDGTIATDIRAKYGWTQRANEMDAKLLRICAGDD